MAKDIQLSKWNWCMSIFGETVLNIITQVKRCAVLVNVGAWLMVLEGWDLCWNVERWTTRSGKASLAFIHISSVCTVNLVGQLHSAGVEGYTQYLCCRLQPVVLCTSVVYWCLHGHLYKQSPKEEGWQFTHRLRQQQSAFSRKGLFFCFKLGYGYVTVRRDPG